jgi:hypothetical protein
MQKAQNYDLSTLPDQANGGALTCLQASSAGTQHTVIIKVPVTSMKWGGGYRFLLHLIDNHASSYKGCNEPAGTITTEEKPALDKNAKRVIDGAISYISSGNIYLAWAHRQCNVRRTTQVLKPAQMSGAINWAYTLKAGQSNPAQGLFISEQMQAAINGIFFGGGNRYAGSSTAQINSVRPVGEVEMNSVWKTYEPLLTKANKHNRWAFSMDTTGNAFATKQMYLPTNGTYWTVNPSMPKHTWGFSDMGALIVNNTPQNLPADEAKSSFDGVSDARTAIGWTAAGDFFILVIGSGNSQASMVSWNDVKSFFQNLPTSGFLTGYGANPISPITYAFMFDGGGSSQLGYVQSTLIISPLSNTPSIQADNAYHGDNRYIASFLGLQWP